MWLRLLACGVLAPSAAVAALTGVPCVDPAWQPSEIRVFRDIEYGFSRNSITGIEEPLLMDAYLPPTSDIRSARPAAVLVHGGAFQVGDKTIDASLATMLAQRGFIAVSVNYRLEPAGLANDEAPLDATEDVRAAIRFLRKHAYEYRIDTNRIMVAGDSAGAITALYLGYVEKAQYEGSSGNAGYRSDVALSISISGELVMQAFCASVYPQPTACTVQNLTCDYTDNVGAAPNQPSLLMVHGTADAIVPFVNAKAIFDRAIAAGLHAKLIAIPSAGHVPFKELFTEGNYFNDFMSFVIDSLGLGGVAGGECPSLAPAAFSPNVVFN
jgi:acetyl esterase/lipase